MLQLTRHEENIFPYTHAKIILKKIIPFRNDFGFNFHSLAYLLLIVTIVDIRFRKNILIILGNGVLKENILRINANAEKFTILILRMRKFIENGIKMKLFDILCFSYGKNRNDYCTSFRI